MYHIGWSLCQIIETSPLYAPVVAEWPSRWVFEVGESPSALMCFIQDLSPCLSAPAGASKVPPRQQYMAQCHGQLEFWATAPLTNMNCFTRVLLNSWHIKSQGCQMSVWGIKLPHLVWPFSSAIWKGQDFQISSWFLSRWDLFMILMSRSHFPAWWPAELTCMSQAQQIGWAYWLLHVLCKRMKHYYPEPCLLVWFKHSCLFKLLLINMLLVRCCSNTNKASLRGKRLLGRCQW